MLFGGFFSVSLERNEQREDVKGSYRKFKTCVEGDNTRIIYIILSLFPNLKLAYHFCTCFKLMGTEKKKTKNIFSVFDLLIRIKRLVRLYVKCN